MNKSFLNFKNSKMKVKILDDIVKENVLKNIEGIPWFYHEYTYKTQLNSFLEKDIGFFTHYFLSENLILLIVFITSLLGTIKS